MRLNLSTMRLLGVVWKHAAVSGRFFMSQPKTSTAAQKKPVPNGVSKSVDSGSVSVHVVLVLL